MTTQIRVCTGSRCGNAGLARDIEELAKAAGCCKVKRTGCVGRCRSAPNVIVSLNGSKDVISRVRRDDLVEIVQEASDAAKAFRSSGLWKPSCTERFAEAFMEFRRGCSKSRKSLIYFIKLYIIPASL